MQGKSVVGSMLGYARTEDEIVGPTDVSAVVEDTVSLLSKEFLSGIALTLELDRRNRKSQCWPWSTRTSALESRRQCFRSDARQRQAQDCFAHACQSAR